MASFALSLAMLYLICGFLFALVFSFRLVNKFDEQAAGSSFGFRLFIIPGTMLLWPFLLTSYFKRKKR
jgi:hypothetical protein